MEKIVGDWNWKWTLLLVILGLFIIGVMLSITLGEIALIVCGAVHLGTGAFDISDGWAIAMIVIGALLFIGNSTPAIVLNARNA